MHLLLTPSLPVQLKAPLLLKTCVLPAVAIPTHTLTSQGTPGRSVTMVIMVVVKPVCLNVNSPV